MYDGVHVDSIHADQSQAARQAAVDNFRCAKQRHVQPAGATRADAALPPHYSGALAAI